MTKHKIKFLGSYSMPKLSGSDSEYEVVFVWICSCEEGGTAESESAAKEAWRQHVVVASAGVPGWAAMIESFAEMLDSLVIEDDLGYIRQALDRLDRATTEAYKRMSSHG